MKKADRRKFARMAQAEFEAAVLYFPPEILDQLNALSEEFECTPGQLIVYAFKSQERRFSEFVEEVMTPLKPGEPEIWPADPLYALACVALLHFMRAFIKMREDPVAFDQLKKDAPAEWFFSSPDGEEDEPADWWKESE